MLDIKCALAANVCNTAGSYDSAMFSQHTSAEIWQLSACAGYMLLLLLT